MSEISTNPGPAQANANVNNDQPLPNNEQGDGAGATVGGTGFQAAETVAPARARTGGANLRQPNANPVGGNARAIAGGGQAIPQGGFTVGHSTTQILGAVLGDGFSEADSRNIARAMNESSSFKNSVVELANKGWTFQTSDQVSRDRSAMVENDKVIRVSTSFSNLIRPEPLIATIAMQSAFAASPVELDWSDPISLLETYKVKYADALVTMNTTVKQLYDTITFDLKDALPGRVVDLLDSIDNLDMAALKANPVVYRAARDSYSSVLYPHMLRISAVADGLPGERDTPNALTRAESKVIHQSKPNGTELDIAFTFGVKSNGIVDRPDVRMPWDAASDLAFRDYWT